ncbi:4Fe-4S binding protein [Zhaonella formicivorans]|uniref:4Fe-4S binding protein n=1 Tax=Zhaonella formicivorans TaxID=2528593 RepID=UPI0010E3ACB2|nr:4Fe-4S binding protein [Zhaonella formicivorans]
MQLLEDFGKIFEAPQFIWPYLYFFATEQEMKLVVAMGKESLTCRDIAFRLSTSEEETRGILEEAYLRYILNKESKDSTVYYSAGTFYKRLNNFCLFGNFYVIPKKIRKKLDEWCFAEYLKRNDNFKKVIAAEPEYDACHNEWIFLLHEVEEMIDRASTIRVLPCDCKMLADNCDHSREICLYFAPELISDRTGGRELTKEEAKELVRKLDREGLMHTGGPPDWREKGPSVVCNCCGCCCYPFRAAKKLGTKGKWPKSRYVAEFDREKCRLCGLCAKRCYFGAFTFDGNEISFNPELCWGCGICAGTCSGKAITMAEL